MRASVLSGGKIVSTTSLDRVRQAHASKERFWLRLEDHTPEVDAFLSGVLGIHSLTIEDIWSEVVTPKVEDFEGYLYVRIHGVSRDGTADNLDLREVDIVVGPDWLVVNDGGDIVARSVEAQVEGSPKPLEQGPVWLAHRLVDLIVDRYFPLIDSYHRAVEQLEQEVVDVAGTARGKEVMGRILGFKHSLHSLRRTSIHQREILYQLSRGDFDKIPPDARVFFRDVYDHFTRVSDLAESYHDLVNSSFEVFLNMQSNRMNEIMKTLTLISTIMLPLTFVAGVYGMNFETMPELRWRFGYGYALLLMLFIAVGIVVWFKWRKWL